MIGFFSMKYFEVFLIYNNLNFLNIKTIKFILNKKRFFKNIIFFEIY